jgi:peptide chain release factor subunit 3
MVRVSTPLCFRVKALTTRGPPLIEFMDNMEILDRDVNAPFMFPVSEKYNEMGTMVMGKIESGRVKKGDTVLVMPNKVSSQVLED